MFPNVSANLDSWAESLPFVSGLNFQSLNSILKIRLKKCADVAELVDAQVSEACCREAVEVRFFSSAPSFNFKFQIRVLSLFAFFASLRETFASMRGELIKSLKANQSAFGLDLAAETIERLADFYEIIEEHNSLLHLVAPCTAEEFAVRHILESLFLLEYLPNGAYFADVGTGAGLPSIPCLIVRRDLAAVLIESKEKKARYLEHALSQLELAERAMVINKQFEEIRGKTFDTVTCRALDKFTEKLPRLLKWSGDLRKVFFGGPLLREALKQARIQFKERLIPMSDQRYIFDLS
jgi:16S rRNA (guanine527-N7)-methyltransferase